MSTLLTYLKSYWAPLKSRWTPYWELGRYHRPVGTLLLYFPCLWGLALSSAANGQGLPSLKWMLLFLIGAALTRGAGCAYNDLVDRDLDRHVARTQNRPLAAGTLTPSQAKGWILLQSVGALGILMCFPPFIWGLTLSSTILVAIYPWCKRWTSWPQLFLGLTFNWGVLVGWFLISPSPHPAVFLMYGAGVFWTLGYDTIYGHMDKEDDIHIGIKSTALLFSHHPKLFLTICYVLFWSLLLCSAWTLDLTNTFSGVLLVSLCPAIAASFFSLRRLNLSIPKQCFQAFKHNIWIGLWVFCALMVSQLF